MLKRKNEAIKFLISYIDKEYGLGKTEKKQKNAEKQELSDALRIAKENGLLGSFSESLQKNGYRLSKEINVEIEKERTKTLTFQETLNVLKQLFEEEHLDLMFIKLFRGLPYVPRDVDILVKPEQSGQLLAAMRRKGFAVKSFQGVENECRKEGLMKIDLYQYFQYLSLEFMDQEFLWKNPRYVNICGVNCKIPSVAADFVSLSIHDLLGHRYLSFLDFLYADEIVSRALVSFDEALQQPKKYRWENAFYYFVSLIKELHVKLRSESSDVSFPFRFPAKPLLKAFGGFAYQEISEQRKCAFILSTLIDRALLEYAVLSRSTSTELSEGVRSNLLRPLHRVRHWVGDSKLQMQ